MSWAAYGRSPEGHGAAFSRHLDLVQDRMITGLYGIKRVGAQLTGFDGAYQRFSGEVRVEHYRADELLDQESPSRDRAPTGTA